MRKPDGTISTHSEPLERLSEKHKWMGWPVIRGVMTLGHAMVLGFRALRYSADVALDQVPPDENGKKVEISGWVAALNIILSVGFFIFLYKFVPLVAATKLKNIYPVFGSQVLFNVVDGVIRIALVPAVYLGRVADARHPAGVPVSRRRAQNGVRVRVARSADRKNAQAYSTFHPRCGTSFLMTVMLISMVIYMLFPVHGFWARFALRIALLPVIAGVSYEMIRFAAKHGTSLFALLTKPGLWLQRITTKPPATTRWRAPSPP